ncbi:alpha/beta hydrolase [Reinekea sp.]|jgi:pimeloyl-ACP methyl ester carboxylesterase|uniref:alpha/beta fold hydrolase n=1 Tax=Reinekea sp. TaxID=1970455 RepID=UPI002A8143A6|nr:alpha/beta hydrolase [Reinekea sp.]
MSRFLFYISLCGFLAWSIYLGLMLVLGWLGPSSYQVDNVLDQQVLMTDLGTIRFQANKATSGSHTVVLLHGFNGSLNNWSALWPLLADCGPAVRLDLPGFGQSHWQGEDFSLDQQSQHLIQFIDALDLGAVTLVGTSMGASLAAWTAARYPDHVAALILMAPSAYPMSMSVRGFEKLFYQNRFANGLARQVVQARVFNYFFPTSRLLQALTVTRSYNANWVAALKQISQPTWVVWSSSDARVPFQYGGRIAGLIPSGHLIAASDRAGHDIPGSDPELVANLICDLKNRGTADYYTAG